MKPRRRWTIWGCFFAEDPTLPAHAASIFWDPRIDGSVIPVEATACHPAAAHAFNLMARPWPIAVLRSGKREEVAIATPHGRIRLSVQTGSVLGGTVRLRYVLDEDRLADRLRALARWNSLLQSSKPFPQNAPPLARRARWPLLIATLDAMADQCSLRETAIRLFGAAIVARDWDKGSDYLKLRTRRLVTQARGLAMGGYRTLL